MELMEVCEVCEVCELCARTLPIENVGSTAIDLTANFHPRPGRRTTKRGAISVASWSILPP
jgi:hypothetical protein